MKVNLLQITTWLTFAWDALYLFIMIPETSHLSKSVLVIPHFSCESKSFMITDQIGSQTKKHLSCDHKNNQRAKPWTFWFFSLSCTSQTIQFRKKLKPSHDILSPQALLAFCWTFHSRATDQPESSFGVFIFFYYQIGHREDGKCMNFVNQHFILKLQKLHIHRQWGNWDTLVFFVFWKPINVFFLYLTNPVTCSLGFALATICKMTLHRNVPWVEMFKTRVNQLFLT